MNNCTIDVTKVDFLFEKNKGISSLPTIHLKIAVRLSILPLRILEAQNKWNKGCSDTFIK